MENKIKEGKKVWIKPELEIEDVLLTEGGRNTPAPENSTQRT
ncbi:MAG: hypothetical protein NT150_15350 [Bacteroidetes bacterium]|nr:hypothetical protein [Bacteroidota bacterium]